MLNGSLSIVRIRFNPILLSRHIKKAAYKKILLSNLEWGPTVSKKRLLPMQGFEIIEMGLDGKDPGLGRFAVAALHDKFFSSVP
jgi:hypothetical protein